MTQSVTKAKPERPRRHRLSNERGSVLALVVMLLIVFLGLCALAIDLGLLFVARGEAQRAADAGAHGGAVYLLHNPEATDLEIQEAAVRAAKRNAVRGADVAIEPEDVEVLRDEEKVRATVFRTDDRENPVPTLFAGVLGIKTVDVGAQAAAELWPADASQCVWPFAIPDRWCTEEAMADGTCPLGAYSDGTDGTEAWDGDDDWYRSYRNPIVLEDDSEYWTGYKDKDRGTELLIKPQSPSGALQPGWYFPFKEGSGAAGYRDAILNCGSGENVFEVGETLYTEPGNMVGPTRQGFEDLLQEYPDASWDSERNRAVGSDRDIAGRTRPVVLFDPSAPPELGRKPFLIEGFAAAFFDDFDEDGNVRVYFVELTGADPAATKNAGAGNPQLKIIRIVE